MSFRLCLVKVCGFLPLGEHISDHMRLTLVWRGGADNGGFCLINTSFQYNGSFRVTDEQAPTTSEGSELKEAWGGGAQQAAQRL